jgi:hypothetical protein
MFAIALYELYFQGEYRYRQWMWRVLPDGTNLDPQGILLNPPTSSRLWLNDLAWDGRQLWSIHAVKAGAAMARTKIACACVDADLDGRNACIDDCDDADPLTAKTKPEICSGGKDEDCDGLADCRDPDCPIGSGPPEVTGLRWTGGTIVWSAAAGAQRYALARGLVSDVRRRADMTLAECVAPEHLGTTWADDGRKPVPGDALWYLVRPEGAPCRLGSWGSEALRNSVSACD